MSYARRVTGSVARGFNTTLSPTLTGYLVGDLLLYATGVNLNTGSVPGTPSGWSKYATSIVTHTILWYTIATSTSMTIPTVTWGGFCWAMLWAVSGNQNTVTGIITGGSDRETNNTIDAGSTAGAFTPSQNSSYVVHVANKNKTSTSDATVFSPAAGFSILQQDVGTGTRPAMIISDWIQGAAASVNANAATGSIGDSTAQANDGIKVAFAPGSAVAYAPNPTHKMQRVYEPIYVHD